MKLFSLRRRRDRELEEEIHAHLEMAIHERIERGETPEQARHAARREFGNLGLIKETTREMWGWAGLENLCQDVRYGLRMLRKSPGFTAVVLAVLALGIGANTAIFSLVDAVLLRSLPVRDPQQLVLLTWRARQEPGYHAYSAFGDCHLRHGGELSSPAGCSFSDPLFRRFRAQTDVFSSVTAFAGAGQLNLSGNGPASVVNGRLVSGSFFQTLGVHAALGRMIRPEDDKPSAAPVAVVSYGYWQRRFGGAASVIGKTVELNRVVFTIVGVAPPQFRSITPGRAYDLWLPLSEYGTLRAGWGKPQDPANWWLAVVGRLRPDTPLARAQAAVNVVFQNELLHGAKPLAKPEDDASIVLAPAQQGLNGGRSHVELPLFVLMMAVGIVLVIACANVAGLMLARSAARRREMAVRLALGAARARVARQLLTESVLLSLLGGLLGCYVAYGGVRLIAELVSSVISGPLPFVVTPDWRVFVFACAVSVFTGILFGLAPAIRSTRVDLTPTLKSSIGDGVTARHGHRWLSVGNALVVAQVALAVVVLAGAGLLVRTLRNLQSVKPGFDANNVLLFGINPTLLDYKPPQIQNLYRELRTRLAALPGVVSASYSSQALLSGALWTTSVRTEGMSGKSGLDVDVLSVGPGFLGTMHIPLLAGRAFDSSDFADAAAAAAERKAFDAPRGPASDSASPASKNGASSRSASRGSPRVPPPVSVLVNQAFARRYLANRNPVGVRLFEGGSSTNGKGPAGKAQAPRWRIVGVVGNTKYNSLRREIHPAMYVPLTGGGAHFELRTAADPALLIPAVREEVAQVDANLPLFAVRTQSAQIQQLLFEERIVSRLSSFFGLLALALACIGLYGLLSYEVGRRTREIGIRVALGAQQRDVNRLVIGRGIALTLAGVAIGLGAAFGVTRYLQSLLYGVRPIDPVTFIAVGLLLLLVALAACYVPARRATRVDPMTCLRFE